MADMKQYVEDVLASIEQKDPEQKMFHDTVSEVFSSIVPVLEVHPKYSENKILERMVEPERTVSFRMTIGTGVLLWIILRLLYRLWKDPQLQPAAKA